MTKRYFVTGTDTEVGKTFATSLMIKALVAIGYKVAGLKPIASDSQFDKLGDYEGLVNSDALSIIQASNMFLEYSCVNPFVFKEPVAPHIAAQTQGLDLCVSAINDAMSYPESDVTFIEGAGGWFTPLNNTETYADWVVDNDLDVILVVGMKLGCLNHAQLTAKAIKQQGLKIKGWVANQLQADMAFYKENLMWLKDYFEEPLLAEISYQQDAEQFKIQSLTNLLEN